MASGRREPEMSSDDEFLQSFKRKSRKKMKKKSNVISDSSESGSDLEAVGKKKVKPLHDESDENSDVDNNIQFYLDSGNESSGDTDVDKCAICLGKFNGQDIATPETCDHTFCFGCLREWCKNVNTCPIDRLKFHLMLIRRHRESRIYKRVSVDSSLDPTFILDYDPEPLVSSNAPLRCAFCGGMNDSESFIPCPDCDKLFHPSCLMQPFFTGSGIHQFCPSCYFSSRTIGSACRYNSRPFSSFNREIAQVRRRHHRRLNQYYLDRDESSSDSEENLMIQHNLRQFEEPVPSNFTLARKQRVRNQLSCRALIPAVGSETSRLGYMYDDLYTDDNLDDGANSDRYNNSDLEQISNSTSMNRNQTSSTRSETMRPKNPENFDLVGSILEGQKVLSCLDILERRKDGSFVVGSTAKQSLSKSSSSIRNNQDCDELPRLVNSRPTMPHTDSVAVKQIPLNPTQNSNSNYRETPQNNYSCTTSTSKGSLVEYDNIGFSARSMFGNTGSERYNNDSTSSSATYKGYCGSSEEDFKKSTNCKEPCKLPPSEDEVDIYSDIESVGEEGEIRSVTGDDPIDIMDAMNTTFKDDSPVSNADPTPDSSENELVIDEDIAGGEEENCKESIHSSEINKNSHAENNAPSAVSEGDSTDLPSVNAEQVSKEISKVTDVSNDGSFPDSCSAAISYVEESSQDASQESMRSAFKESPELDERTNESQYDESELVMQKDKDIDANDKDSIDEDLTDVENEATDVENEATDVDNEVTDVDNNAINVDNDAIGIDNDAIGVDNDAIGVDNDVINVDNDAIGVDNDAINVDIKATDVDDDAINVDIKATDVDNDAFNVDIKATDVDEMPDHASMEDKHEHTQGIKSSGVNDEENYVDVTSNENSNDSFKMSPEADAVTSSASMSPKLCDEKLKPKSFVEQVDSSPLSGTQEIDSFEKKIFDENLSPEQDSDNACVLYSQARDVENSSCSFDNSQIAHSEHEADTNYEVSQTFSEEDKKGESDICMKSDNETDENNDIADYPENPSTPCLDENMDENFGNSPLCDEVCENSDVDSRMEIPVSDDKSYRTPGSENEQNENLSLCGDNLQKYDKMENDDLGIEDISEAGSGDLDDDFPDETLTFPEANHNFDEKSAPKFEYNKKVTERYQSFDDCEEGEIIEEKTFHRPGCKQSSKYSRYQGDRETYDESSPRKNISDLPRIPKIKHDREKNVIPVDMPPENKRTSVLGKVDLGGGDISWKRLSKHTRERSYRDGKPKEEKVLYRERESRKKEKDSYEHDRKSDNKSTSRRDRDKLESDKSRNEKDPRFRKSDKRDSNKKDRLSDREYLDREKSLKSHKEKHSEKHKDRKESPRRDKSKHSKTDFKSGRDKNMKSKGEDRYEREPKLEKTKKFDRVIYEKGKCKEKDHKSKHKEKKNEIKVGKDHIRDKHKLSHVLDHLSDKQRDVRSFDHNLKIVVEQKEKRSDKTKLKDKKEDKLENKQIQVEKRKPDIGRIPYSELTSIESKEIFAKGDSIIINVNFNRTNQSKDTKVDNPESKHKDRKSEECEIIAVKPAKDKCKKLPEKGREVPSVKRPVTPPERPSQVLSVSECYWQGGQDSDASSDSKSIEEIPVEEGNETKESDDLSESDSSSCSSSSSDASESEEANEGNTCEEKPCEKTEKVDIPLNKVGDSVSTPIKRKSPRSPSPPSPADNDSYDPCEPTRSPSPPPVPPAPPLPAGNPKPPPPPELPPLPPEPEPVDSVPEQNAAHLPSSFASVSSVSASSQTIAANQNSAVNPSSMLKASTNILIPPPNYISHTPVSSNSMAHVSPVIPQANFNYQIGNPGNMLFQSNPVQQVLRGILPSQLHHGTAIPPPPNPPSLPNMASVPPPPPPPSAMALISQMRHSLPQVNVRPSITANTILQSLTMGHPLNLSQLQMSHLQHMPPNFSNPASGHQSSLMMASHNQTLNLPVSMSNQVLINQNPLMSHPMALQSQNLPGNPLGPVPAQHTLGMPQTLDKAVSEINEVVDMEVDSPYSPGDVSLDESVCDYSPTCSPLPSGFTPPKTQDVFDSLLPTDYRTPEKRTIDAVGRAEKSKLSESSDSKRSRHEHKKHSIRMQMDSKGRHRREPKAEKKLDDSQLKILDELPSSAVEMQVKEKFLKKLNRQERVVEEVKLALKPYYKSRDVNKEEYKDILRKSVPKICHNKSGEINPVKVKAFIDCYIKKLKHARKKKHSLILS